MNTQNHDNQDILISFDGEISLEAEADAIANEIIEELGLEAMLAEEPVRQTAVISIGHANGDMSSQELDARKIARLRRQIRAGEYKVDAMAIATSMVLSGDLS